MSEKEHSLYLNSKKRAIAYFQKELNDDDR